jgi:FKBP-type peptidyl-prolyl cis-trans isomerase
MTPDGVRVLTLQAGEGPAAVPGERIEVRVQGRLRDGSTFLTQVGAVDADVRDRARLIVPGFAPALEALRAGERRLVLIPHPLGYGTRPPAPIVPRHADLVYDVTRLFVRVKDLVVGLGEEARAGDNVLVHYRGTLADGTVFDDSRVNNKGEPLTLPLRRPGSGRGGVIEGWLRGLPGMRVGGTRRLEIPAHLAYGEAGSPNGKVPPDADLTFVVELFGLPDDEAPAR